MLKSQVLNDVVMIHGQIEIAERDAAKKKFKAN